MQPVTTPPPLPGLALVAVALTACGPSLRDSADFTPQAVRQLLFDDQCQLQAHFDQTKANLKPQSDFSLGMQDKAAAGTAVFNLKPGPNAEVFFGLVRRYYKRVQLPPKTTLRINVPYHLKAGLRTMPIGAEIAISHGDEEIELPYHPCVGAFFFGNDHYTARRKLIAQN